MSTLNQEFKDILAFEEESGSLRQERAKKLQERVLNGETTGDKILDFLIARFCYGYYNEDIGKMKTMEQMYRDLETRIKKHVGEPFLVTIKQKSFYPLTNPLDDWLRKISKGYTEDIYLGVLKGSSLIFDVAAKKCEIPLACYVERCNIVLDPKTSYVEGNIIFSQPVGILATRSLDLFLVQTLSYKRRSLIVDEPFLMVEVRVGNDEIESWFLENEPRHHVAFLKAAEFLPANGSWKIFQPDQWYKKLLKDMAKLSQEVKVLSKLYTSCEEEEERLLQRIEGIQNEIEKRFNKAFVLNSSFHHDIAELIEPFNE